MEVGREVAIFMFVAVRNWTLAILAAVAGLEVAAIWIGVISFIVLVIALPIAVVQRYRRTEAYSELARRYHGTCQPGGLFSRRRVTFVHAGARVDVDVYYTGGTYYTQVHFTGQQPTVRCEVYPEGGWSRVGELRGMEDVLIGSPAFDDWYVIKGDSRAALRSLLSPGVQGQIERLRGFLGNGDIYISFNRRELLVKKRSFIRDYHRLREFTELAIGLYDQSVLTGQEGIEFVGGTMIHDPPVPTTGKGIEFIGDGPPLPEVKEAVCQICGEMIASDMVFCRRCRTPHHQDCWKYYGACSTYGCRETRYLRPESKRAKRARKKIRL